MNIASLQQFIVLVPTCGEAEALEKVGQLFQQNACDQIVVLNQEQAPLGLLTFRQFILQGGQIPGGWSESGDGTEINVAGDPQASTRSLVPFLAPLPCLSAESRIEEIQPYLHRLEQHDWALIDRENRFVGLLDRLRLLQFLAMRSTVAASVQKNQPSQRSTTLRQRQVIELPAPENTSSTTTTVDPLIDLLERMPIPLMLQTSTGRVITQNLAWRQQVGELRDPGQVRREAAVILEATQRGEDCAPEMQCFPDDHSLGNRDGAGRSLTAHSHLSNLPWHDPATSSADMAHHLGSCHLGTEPNSCVCICPMKNGQERVWKFLKVAMGTSPANLQPIERVTAGVSAAVSESSPGFKLATLGFSPDPTWRSLSQTEFLWLVLAQDMTEQHQIARELAAKNADLVQLNRLKDEFLSCISHELKTPLTAVLGLSSLLKDHLLGELNERQSRYAHLIYQSGRHLILIVNDILDLTRIETGQLDLTLEPVEIRAACLEAYQQAQQSHVRDAASATPEPEHDAIQFSLDIQAELTTIVADETRLRQMLSNLLSNALKFTETEGAIGLKVEEWEGWIAFTVWDTGIGIPADKQHLIFQKFQQLENPLTRQFEGTGLGLVLTQRLARLHGGDVTFTSIEGQGSQFTLLLPPSPPQSLPNFKPQVLKMSRSLSITAGNRLALVVEAMPQQIEELSRQLMQLGYRVAIARSGTEALEKSRRLQPGVIFLNPSLPMLSGWDVLTLLKTDEATRNLPVVVTATRVDRDQACQSGANSFLSLPVQSESLQRCLARLIEQTHEELQDRCPNLTVLHLHGSFPALSDDARSPSSVQEVHRLLHPYQCRVLEVDDLEQADLLAKVWKPNVILIDGVFPDPFASLKQLSQYPTLASLPLVTLTVEITHAANLVPGLMVFPCLAINDPQLPQSSSQMGTASDAESSALWQAIQIAVGIHWTPHIVLADLSLLESNWAATTPADLCQNVQFTPGLTSLNSVQTVVHYLQIAGFRCSMGQSWQEIVQQLDHHSVDVLLFCVHANVSLHLFLEISQTLEQLESKPPILVWNCTAKSTDTDPTSNQNSQATLQTMWGAITPQILPCNVSMSDLLAQINQVLIDR